MGKQDGWIKAKAPTLGSNMKLQNRIIKQHRQLCSDKEKEEVYLITQGYLKPKHTVVRKRTILMQWNPIAEDQNTKETKWE